MTKLIASFFLLIISTFLFQGCQKVSTGENFNGSVNGVEKTAAPYPNEEPERYQTEIWQTSAKGVEKFFMMRDGEKWRMDALFGDPEQVTTIHTDKEYVISMATKVYAEYPIGHGFDEREDMVRAMTYGMLNNKAKGIYENLGNDGGLTKYKVLSDADKGKESLVYFDDKLGLPVKKEVFGSGDTGQNPEMTITVSDFKTDTDEKLFVLPTGLKKISAEEMKNILVGNK